MRIKKTDFLWIFSLSVLLSGLLAFLQRGGWLGFFVLSLPALTILRVSSAWSNGGRKLALIVALAFLVRLTFGAATYILLPIYGYADSEDSQAGYYYTDSHKRDDQAWELAVSGKPLAEAFSGKYSSDQYGGLLALSALTYRSLSPDAQRPLLLILLAALIAATGVPFFWKAAERTFGEKIAWVSAWIFALYPESIMLGGSAMREPYLLTFSAVAFWGFAVWRDAAMSPPRSTILALGLSLLGMLLISPAAAVFMLIVFAGWVAISRRHSNISWKVALVFGLVFLLGLFTLSTSLNRKGVFEDASPLSVLNSWLQLSVKWNAYQIERESGWIQKLFDEMPEGARLPFVALYGVLQPVLPAALIAPTLPIWKIIAIARALGWYALLPLLILSVAANSNFSRDLKRAESDRNIFIWLALLVWIWILLAALRGGGDQWDNPRYRTIMFMWQALLAGHVWIWRQETRSVWFVRTIACEGVFILIFTQWYASRYFHIGGQMPFVVMIAAIVGLWGAIVGGGWWLDRRRNQTRAM
ncbi:MAG: hypothetical protein OZ914_06710 [Anaerolineaceae bacterium]|jgi:hypothetical protein|nr:hypothetical protein [Anaerolineaceae bacterium]